MTVVSHRGLVVVFHIADEGRQHYGLSGAEWPPPQALGESDFRVAFGHIAIPVGHNPKIKMRVPGFRIQRYGFFKDRGGLVIFPAKQSVAREHIVYLLMLGRQRERFPNQSFRFIKVTRIKPAELILELSEEYVVTIVFRVSVNDSFNPARQFPL